jgi:photosystem II stability/assembly factor-like uncharacterized protein
MSDRHRHDDFDATVRRTLAQVSTAVRPDAGLADRLVNNARADAPPVIPLHTPRRRARWLPPLLAAASIVALVVGGAVTAKVLSEGDTKPALQPTPAPTTPFPPAPAAPVVAHFRAETVSFTDAQHGWALGDAKCPSRAKTDCPTLLATTNGGGSWRALGVPNGLVSTFDGASCGTNGGVSGPCVDAVTFANKDVGYLWSLHETYVTTDGGRTWSRYTNPTTDWDGASSLVVTNHAVVRVAAIHQCSAGCAGAVETAPLGTTHFTTVHPSSQQVGLGSSRLGVHDGKVYLFAGGVGLDNGGLSSGPGLLRSSDGGQSWQRVSADPCGNQAPFGEYDFMTPAGLTVVWCGSGVRVAAAGSAQFSALRPLQNPDAPVYPVAARSADDITIADFTDAYNGDARNDHTSFEVTRDGGRTWQRSPVLPVQGDAFTFVTGTVGYAASETASVLYTTHDGGLTWTVGSFAR